MKRALILCLFLAVTGSAGNCATSLFPPLQPIGGAKTLQQNDGCNINSLADPLVKDSYAQDLSVSYPKINQVENSLYGRIYSDQDILLRISRIEKSIFSKTYSNSTLAQRVDNIMLNFNQLNAYPNISMNALSKMESKIFKRNFAQNDTQSRVEQLEQQVFGTVQSGDISSRYETLKSAVANYKVNQLASNPYQDPMVRPQGRLKGIAGAIGDMLLGGGGFMTGFTPSLDPFSNNYNNTGYNNYNNAYNSGSNNYNGYSNMGGSGGNGLYNNYANLGSPNGYGLYNGNRTNHGYSDAFQSYGAQSGVTILD